MQVFWETMDKVEYIMDFITLFYIIHNIEWLFILKVNIRFKNLNQEKEA